MPVWPSALNFGVQRISLPSLQVSQVVYVSNKVLVCVWKLLFDWSFLRPSFVKQFPLCRDASKLGRVPRVNLHFSIQLTYFITWYLLWMLIIVKPPAIFLDSHSHSAYVALWYWWQCSFIVYGYFALSVTSFAVKINLENHAAAYIYIYIYIYNLKTVKVSIVTNFAKCQTFKKLAVGSILFHGCSLFLNYRYVSAYMSPLLGSNF